MAKNPKGREKFKLDPWKCVWSDVGPIGAQGATGPMASLNTSAGILIRKVNLSHGNGQKQRRMKRLKKAKFLWKKFIGYLFDKNRHYPIIDYMALGLSIAAFLKAFLG